MNNVNKTLYIPLFGKAFVSKKGIIIEDKWAEKIWDNAAFPLHGKARSKWLAYYMGMRARVFDDWVRGAVRDMPSATIIHIGCGLDSRAMRLYKVENLWYDVDFPEVIAERRRYFEESERYKMIEGDAKDPKWLIDINGDSAIVIMEGISMYLDENELSGLFSALSLRFGSISLLMDCYSIFAAKMSKYKNPVNSVGVTRVYGIDDPKSLEKEGNLSFVAEHEITPAALINSLRGTERFLFKKLYGGNFAKKLYKLYEYRKEDKQKL